MKVLCRCAHSRFHTGLRLYRRPRVLGIIRTVIGNDSRTRKATLLRSSLKNALIRRVWQDTTLLEPGTGSSLVWGPFYPSMNRLLMCVYAPLDGTVLSLWEKDELVCTEGEKVNRCRQAG